MDGLGGSAMFAAHFRENAARALLLPRRRPGQRTPLWMQRQRSADLLAVASRYGSFPIILETYREVLRDVFDLPALRELLDRHSLPRHSGGERGDRAHLAVRDRPCSSTTWAPTCTTVMRHSPSGVPRHLRSTVTCSPNCSAPRSCASCSTLPPPRTSSWSSRRWPAAGVRGRWTASTTCCDGSATCASTRLLPGSPTARPRPMRLPRWRPIAARSGVRLAGEERWIAVEDVARYRDALGASPPPGVAETWLAEAADGTPPLDALLLRWARTHAPFTPAAPAHRWGIAQGNVTARLEALAAAGTLVEGAFRPGGTEHEFADPEVLRAPSTPIAGATAARGGAGCRRGLWPIPARLARASTGGRARRSIGSSR